MTEISTERISLDPAMVDHPKLRRVSSDAFRLYFRALFHAFRCRTDGFCEEAMLRELATVRRWRRLVDELRDAALTHEVEGGWVIHDYLDWQPSREELAQIEEERETRQEAEREAARKRQERKRKGVTPMSRRDKSVTPDFNHVNALCSLLANLVVLNGCKEPKVTERWRNSARLLIRERRELRGDGKELEEITWLIRWTLRHEFWRGNVQSMPKFRQQYDQVRLQALRGARGTEDVLALPPSPNGSGPTGAREHPADIRIRELDAISERLAAEEAG